MEDNDTVYVNFRFVSPHVKQSSVFISAVKISGVSDKTQFFYKLQLSPFSYLIPKSRVYFPRFVYHATFQNDAI